MAAYAAYAGLEAHVYMPRDAPMLNQIEVQMHGAQLILVDGLINEAARQRAAASHTGAMAGVDSVYEAAFARAGIEYPDEMPFNHSIAMVDMQLNHATRWALPSAAYPGEEGWYFNQGAKTGLTEEFFTISHMIQVGH